MDLDQGLGRGKTNRTWVVRHDSALAAAGDAPAATVGEFLA